MKSKKRKTEERIGNLHEKAWDQRNIQKEKERGSTIYKRDCERDKQEHSRGSFKSIVQPWSRDLSKLSRDLQSTINLFSSIRSSVHPLWENPKRGSSFE